MHNQAPELTSSLQAEIIRSVAIALDEDIGTGDITAQLVPEGELATAEVITREDCVFCGKAWVEETFHQLDENVEITWNISDGEIAHANQILFTLQGNARSLLTGERTALNFVQLLSGTATVAAQYAKLVAGTDIKILDTRKTIPGLRLAQKYAVTCGGCHNHRIGLFDAFLIKENHIMAAGSIAEAVTKAREIAPGKPIEVEVESLDELDQALAANADIIMLDEMDLEQVQIHLQGRQFKAQLEASGNINLQSSAKLQQYNSIISRISIGALTKHITCIDLSMRVTSNN
ncbi:carboxylating nicotinate-nucleotide diphosphorylase [Gilvimarinus agarilyticus]|uniref:carboxylating nicotinate-nucleotide diphosphorylase n=1 Tax=Gilvimarinus sp. 2_MG-2023 TaxID=3062666 RepID=UPI001C09F9BE|nr:carboxylating nicotinate-nucleotide diphosphorylase [Gilvimarinus sp. 2_MG-2023]MBU2885420.1 carboxylating nicotinate-nucleotide diphosphorylase [Gilvimarinus agarilyticus]MDO6570320.1 carboxylating nicotinate-nucleotide diphosphorylase [Gilvimarinus sp. 2_MG-2023]